MLRWIGGCAVVVVLVVVIGMFVGYRQIDKMAAEGPEETVVIHAPAPRVYAMVANADSLSEWRMEGLGIRASRAGLLREGDSLILQSSSGPSRNVRSVWHVSRVVPGVLIAFEMRGSQGTVATRKDSVIALGDTTQIISSFVATMADSIRASSDSTDEPALVGMTTKLFISAGRIQTRTELQRLKARIEGDTARPISGY